LYVSFVSMPFLFNPIANCFKLSVSCRTSIFLSSLANYTIKITILIFHEIIIAWKKCRKTYSQIIKIAQKCSSGHPQSNWGRQLLFFFLLNLVLQIYIFNILYFLYNNNICYHFRDNYTVGPCSMS